jgi:RNA recognition motif-containing protein
MPRTTLYVANLGHSVDREELARLFAAYGVVCSAELIDQFKTVDSTRAALVEMASEEGASAAIAGLHGAPLRGGPLVVGWVHGEQPATAGQDRMYESMNVPAKGEDPESPDANRRDCHPMLP